MGRSAYPLPAGPGRLALSAVPPRSLGLLAAVATGQAAATTAVALVIGWSFDRLLLAETSTPGLAPWLPVVLFVALAVVAGLLRAGERVLSERCGQSAAHGLRLRLWDHLQDLPADAVRGERHGAVMLRFLGDLTSLRVWVSRGFVGGVVALATLLGGLSALLWLDVPMAIAVGLCILATLMAQTALGPTLQQKQKDLRRARTRLAIDVMERVEALGVVQSFGQQRRERRRVRSRSDELRARAESFARVSGANLGLSDGASLLMAGVVFAIALRGGALGPTPGDLAAGLVLVRLLGRPVRLLARVQERWHRMVVAEQKIRTFLELEPQLRDNEGARRLPLGSGTVKFRSVSVEDALEDVSAVAPAGSLVRIEGANGAGKSTLLQILAALRRPDSGRAVVDGRDLARCRLGSLRREVGVVSADLPLMRGTVRRNLLYRKPQASPAELEEIIERLDLQPLIDRLPAGLRTRVAEGGKNLSSGERQRLQMARAALASPRVLILDEPDAHLDSGSRVVLRRFLEDYPGTVLVVWHGQDPPRADRVWHLDQGRLIRRRRPKASKLRLANAGDVP